MASGWDTAANVLSDAAIELGLVSAVIADPFDATITDPNFILLRSCLKALGRELVDARAWSHLQQEWLFSSQNGVSLYPLPPDFARDIDNTQYDRTNRLQLSGPLSPQQHQFLKSLSTSGVVYSLFRTTQDQFLIYPSPGATVLQFAYEYISRFWVQPAPTAATLALAPLTTNWDTVLAAAQGGLAGNAITITSVTGAALSLTRSGYDFTLTFINNVTTVAQVEALVNALTGSDRLIVVQTPGTPANLLNTLHGVLPKTNLAGGLGSLPTKEVATTKDDVLWFQPSLLVAGCRLKFRQRRRQDSTVEQDDYNAAWEAAKSADGAAAILSLNQRGQTRLLDASNIPQTGYGA